MTTNIEDLPADELQRRINENTAASEAAASELERRAIEQATIENAKQADRYAAIIKAHVGFDRDLTAQGSAAKEAFQTAVNAGDIAAAFEAHVTYHAIREARRQLRDLAAEAETHAQTGTRILHQLTYYQPDFAADLDRATVYAARNRGSDITDQLIESIE
jgi:hypothetical protein